MDLQTQVVDQETQVSSQEVNLSGRVAAFRDELARLRAFRVGVIEKMRSVAEHVKEAVAARDNLLGLFRSEAVKMRPELLVKDVYALVQSNSAPIEVQSLWSVYQGRLNQIQISLAQYIKQFNSLMQSNDSLAASESSTLQMYSSLASSFPGQVTSVTDMKASLQALDAIPQVDEGSVIATQSGPSAIEQLDPDTADMVTLQAVNMESNYDPRKIRQELQDTMLEAPQETQNNETLDITPQSVVSRIKPWQIFLAGAGLAYLFFGGKK